jgi:hypothetical protein
MQEAFLKTAGNFAYRLALSLCHARLPKAHDTTLGLSRSLRIPTGFLTERRLIIAKSFHMNSDVLNEKHLAYARTVALCFEPHAKGAGLPEWN